MLAIVGAIKAFMPKECWYLLAILAAGLALVLWLDNRDDANIERGQVIQREADLTTTLVRTEKANEARDEIRNDVPNARYAQCLRTARTPANCKRFMPQQ